MTDRAANVAGVVLAGGASKRMGGAVKGLLPLAGRPLLRRVIDRVAPQVGRLVLSVQQPSPDLERFGLPQVPDPFPDGGPLAGLFAAMSDMRSAERWLLLVPCDAPFLPADLAPRLLARAAEVSGPAAAVRYGGCVQPTFSVWHRDLLPLLETAVLEKRMAGLREFCGQAGAAELDWAEEEPPPFFNINDREALGRAARLVGKTGGAVVTC